MKQLLIYERAIPVNPRQHKDVSIKLGGDYGFARGVNSVPLMTVEFDPACAEYAIVFGGDGPDVMPLALLGIRDNENLYVDDNGAWNAKYIPAFVRRYPFVFSSPDGSRFTLCLDEEFQGVNRRGLGERLFDAEGERTRYLQSVLNFLQAYQAQHEATRAFSQRLVELDLLEAMQAQFTLRSGQRITLGGFMAVSRARLRALSGDALARLVASGDLDLIYAHLHSQRNFTPTAERIVRVLEPAPAAPADGVPAEPGEEQQPADA
jgi:SapC protein